MTLHNVINLNIENLRYKQPETDYAIWFKKKIERILPVKQRSTLVWATSVQSEPIYYIYIIYIVV